jgi:phosphopantothenoylcysteine decarboxylase/phosphopantothenate--cysteine ligase
MAEPTDIADAVSAALGSAQDLAHKTVLISAGPTLEDLDPVRFLSNRSSGRMGFSLARAARDRGAHVIVVAGPTSVEPPAGVELIAVRSARDMQRAIDGAYERADVIVMTAAVADYRPAEVAESKIKKHDDELSVQLVKNPDILAELGARRRGPHPVLVGFAMETGDLRAYGRKKLEAKKVDLIVANEAAVGFGGDDTQAILIDHQGEHALPPTSKLELAHRILDRVVAMLPSR